MRLLGIMACCPSADELRMSNYESRMREYERAKKRQEREEIRIAREIGQTRMRQEKANELERAQLEVDEFEAQKEVILSLHREVGEQWDWPEIAATLPPPPPAAINRRQMRALQDLAIASEAEQKRAEDIIEEARKGDRLEGEAALRIYETEKAEGERMSALARRILAGDVSAYREVINEFCPLAELLLLGSSIEFIAHSSTFIECFVAMNDTSVIPAESKALTASGKLSVKPMPRQEFHEIYQDYICGGVLRVAREMCALLPVEDVLVTISTSVFDLTGRASMQPVLSAVVSRSDLKNMNFEQLDASDTIETLACCSDFKATRKTGAFQPIIPIKYEHVALVSDELNDMDALLSRSVNLRNELKEQLGQLHEASIP